MSVQLVGLWMENPYDWHKHPAYINWILQNSHRIGMLNSADKQQVLNQMLTEYNGRLQLFKFNHVILEFDTQEDLTQFVLTWS